jgi:hypothetical protein
MGNIAYDKSGRVIPGNCHPVFVWKSEYEEVCRGTFP